MLALLKNIAKDDRIPARDKKVIFILLLLIASPIDFIPDWIPTFGQMDDIVCIALILDYFFSFLDKEILLSHWPWSMKSFITIKKTALMIGFFAPSIIKKRIWTYQPSPY